MLKRVVKYVVAMLGSQAISVGNSLLLVPLFLKHWPAVVYGEWLALSSVAAYLSTLDFGMNSAVGNRMLTAHTRGDTDDYLRCQHSALTFYGCLALIATIASGICCWILPVSRLLGLHHISQRDAAITIWLLSVQVLVMMPCGFIGNVYRTLGDPARSQWINNARMLLGLAITIIALMRRASLPELALWQLVPVLVVTLYVVADLKARMPSFMPGTARADRRIMRQLLAPSLQFGIILIALAITQQGSVLIVSTALGGVAVAIFVTTRTLTNLVMQVFQTVNFATHPNITMQWARGDFERIRHTHRILIALSTSLCVAAAAALWFEGPEVMTRWTHGKLHVDPAFLHLMLLYTVLQAPWRSSSIVALATNNHRQLSVSYLASSVIGIAVAACLVRFFGLLAIPIGLIAGEAASCYHFVLRDSCTLVDEKYSHFATRLWLAFASICVIAIGAGWIGHSIARGPNLVRWSEVSIITFGAVLAAMWGIWMNGYDRTAVMRRIRHLRPLQSER